MDLQPRLAEGVHQLLALKTFEFLEERAGVGLQRNDAHLDAGHIHVVRQRPQRSGQNLPRQTPAFKRFFTKTIFTDDLPDNIANRLRALWQAPGPVRQRQSSALGQF